MYTDEDILQQIQIIQEAIKNKEWRRSEQFANKILQKHPNEPEALMYLGITKAAQGFEPEGEHLLLASLTLNPRSKEAYYNLGLIVLNQGRCIFAADAFQRGLEIDPSDHALHFQLGCAFERSGKHDEAIESFEKALLHSPYHTDLDFRESAKERIQRIRDTS